MRHKKSQDFKTKKNPPGSFELFLQDPKKGEPGLMLARLSTALKNSNRSAGCKMPDSKRVQFGIPDACDDCRVGIKEAPGLDG